MSEVKSKRCLYCHVEKPLNLENFDLNRRNYDFNKVCPECMTNQRDNRKENKNFLKTPQQQTTFLQRKVLLCVDTALGHSQEVEKVC